MKKLKRNLAPILSLVFGLTIFLSALAFADIEANNENLSDFPAVGVAENQVIKRNNADIEKVYSNGWVTDNYGRIGTLSGTVNNNYGVINEVHGHVGINDNKIDKICTPGELGANNLSKIVETNESLIQRNDGTVNLNTGTIVENYGIITLNAGNITMYNGTVEENGAAGSITFVDKDVAGQTIPSKGTVTTNNGNIIITNGTVTIKENSAGGSITLNEGSNVTIENNKGLVTLNEGSSVTITESSGKISKDPSATNVSCKCTTNTGTIEIEDPEKLVPIVVEGDEGTLIITECLVSIGGVNYTANEYPIFFELPDDYGCLNVETFAGSLYVETALQDGDTEFKIICHKHIWSDWKSDSVKHWKECTVTDCTKKKDESSHTWKWVKDGNATYEADGTKHEECNICGFTKGSVADPGSMLTHSSSRRSKKDKEDDKKKDETPIVESKDENPIVDVKQNDELDKQNEEKQTPIIKNEIVKPVIKEDKKEKIKPVEVKKQDEVIETKNENKKEDLKIEETNTDDAVKIEEELNEDEEIESKLYEEKSNTPLPAILIALGAVAGVSVITAVSIVIVKHK